MRNSFRGLVAVALLSVSNIAAAVTLVDTGQPSPANPNDFTSDRYRAGQFRLDSAATITAVERFASVFQRGSAEFRIYADAGGLPGAAVPGLEYPFVAEISDYGWIRASGLDWTLGPGTYWLALGWVLNTQDGPARFAAPFCPGQDTACIPNALLLEAGVDSFNPWTWGPRGARTGWRIEGDVIPEPGALVLLGLGLAGIGLRRRRA
jgi:hypothetical protein